ncbi:hypothetical protein D3C80_766970 [compost metagenome]
MVGNRGEVHLELRPFGLLVDLQPLQHAGRAASSGGHDEMVFADAGSYAVIEDHAVFLAHQAVARLADVELSPGVGVDAVEKLTRVRALDVDFAQGRGIEQANTVTHRFAFTGHRGMNVFAITREVPRPLPLADVFKLGTVLQVPGVQRGKAHRLEQMTAMAPSHRAEGDRRVVGAEHGGAHFRDGNTHGACSNGQAVDVAQFALVGTEAQCRVTLNVFDRLEAFTGSQLDGGRGDVILLVDELLRCTCGVLVMGHLEQCQGGLFLTCQHLWQAACHCLEACFGGSAYATFKTVCQAVAQREHAVDATDTHAFLRGVARYEAKNVFTPNWFTAQVRSQMHHRTVAAGGGNQVAVQPLAGAGNFMRFNVDSSDTGSGNMLAATGFDHRAGGQDANALGPRLFYQRTTWVMAGVSDGDYFQTSVMPVQGHAIGMVVVGRQHQVTARRHAITTHVGRHRPSEHVARHIVVAVHQRTLMGTRGEHHTLGPHPMHALAHSTDRRAIAEVVGQALVDSEEVVVVIAVDR